MQILINISNQLQFWCHLFKQPLYLFEYAIQTSVQLCFLKANHQNSFVIIIE